jgi:hypothetical protein
MFSTTMAMPRYTRLTKPPANHLILVLHASSTSSKAIIGQIYSPKGVIFLCLEHVSYRLRFRGSYTGLLAGPQSILAHHPEEILGYVAGA